MKKRNACCLNVFLELLILRERHRPQTRRLTSQLQMTEPVPSIAVPIRLHRHWLGANWPLDGFGKNDGGNTTS